MSLKGDGKPVSFIEDCAVPLEHLAEYTDALTEVFAQQWHARHLVRACLGRHAARAADSGHAPGRSEGGARQDARHRRGGRGCWCANTAAPTAASTATACAAANGFAGNSGHRSTRRSAPSSERWTRSGCSIPARSSIRRGWTRPRCSASRRPRRRIPTARRPLEPALDWSGWNVQNDPLTERTTDPGTGGDNTLGFAKAVEMCNNNGQCRKFDAGTMCPSYRVTRDEQHLTRGRANTLRLALSGQLGADALTSRGGARRDGAVRRLQGLQARMSHRRRHGQDENRVSRALQRRAMAIRCSDRLIARLPDYAPILSRAPWLANLRNRLPGAKSLSERLLGLSARRSLPPGAPIPFGARIARGARTAISPG